jgi:hypothetical protein
LRRFGSYIGMRKLLFWSFPLLMLLICQCGNNENNRKNDRPLAQVYNQTLYTSDVEGLVPSGTAKEDSLLLINARVQRWVEEQLMMYEAERNIPKDSDLDELVRSYRASLVRFNFEEQLIAEKLDSNVQETELRAFYDANKDQFQLESTILKCQLLKLPADAPQNELNKLWYSRKDSDQAKLEAYAKKYAVVTLLDPEKWYKLEEIAAILPKSTLTADNIGSRRDGTLSDGEYRFYYRIPEALQGKATAPFEYARAQAATIILHRRKQKLLEDWKDALYQKELKRENIKIY